MSLGEDERRRARAEESVVLVYEPSPKHKPVPSPGKHGSLCPRHADGPGLLQTSDVVGGKRYATDGVDAYCAQQHREGRWHGYPVGWEEVPPTLVSTWVAAGRVDRRSIRRARRGRGR